MGNDDAHGDMEDIMTEAAQRSCFIWCRSSVLLGTVFLFSTWNPCISVAVSSSEKLAEAETAESLRRFDQAATAYRDHLLQNPHNDQVRAKLARVLAWSGQYTDAEQLYRDILSRHPNDLDIQTALARVKAWQGDYVAAQRLCEAVLRLDPANDEARRGLADTLYWSHDYSKALAEYERVAAARPSNELTQRIEDIRALQDQLTQSQRLRAPVGPDRMRPILPFRDYAKVGYGHYPYTHGIADERHYLVEGAHAFGEQTAVARVEPTDRFGLTDVPLSGELYSPLWHKAWGYLTGAVTPNAQFMPDYAIGGEVYQGLSPLSSALSAFEPSLGYRHLQFKSTGIDLLVPGLTVYLPYNIWITEKVYLVPTTGAVTLSSMLTWRPTERVQVWISGAFGTSGERIFAQQDFVRVPSTIFQGGLIFPLSASLSAEVLGLYEDRESLYRRQGGMVNLIWHY